jgi:CheY-like chemotaxis protein
VSVVGSLEDLSFPDILQVVHLSRQSGTLILSAADGERRVRFRHGLVCDASLGTDGPLLEDLLVTRGLVPPACLPAARARREETGESLPAALVALGAVSQESLEAVVRDELRTLLRSFLTMQEGEFRFEVDESVAPPDEAALREGLGPDAILGGLPEGAPPPRWPESAEDSATGVPRRVLLISERSLVTLSLREELERVGFAASACDGVDAGLDMARGMAARSEPFLLVADLVLPDRTRTGWGGGLELVREIRRLAPGLVAIAIGESRHPSVATAARAAGATGYLALPDLGNVPFDEIGVRLRDFCTQVGAALSLADQVATIDWGAGPRVIRVTDPLSLLRGLIGELNAGIGGDISLLVLRLASEYFERAALFAVTNGKAICRGAFGAPLDTRLRGATLPLETGSMLEGVAARAETSAGPIPDNDANRGFLRRLGDPPPRSAAVLPVVGGGMVHGLLYGDNAATGTAFDDLRPLEIFLSQAGLSVQNTLLRRRIDALEEPCREAAA